MDKGSQKFWDVFLKVLEIVLPFLFSGGILWLFTEFKQYFPSWLYTIIILLTAVTLIGLLFRLVFGDLIGRLINSIHSSLENREEIRFASHFSHKWDELSTLLNRAFQDGVAPSATMEESFSILRIWFISNRSRFNQEWRIFLRSRTPGSIEHYGEYSIARKVLSQEDDFSAFYQPSSIMGVAHELGIQSQMHSAWEPNRRKVRESVEVMTILTERLLEYTSWRNTLT